MLLRCAGIVVLAFAVGACRAVVTRQVPATAGVRAMFGPVIGAEVIAGRADDGEEVLLLAGGADLVRIDLAAARASRVRLQIGVVDQCWSLARLAGGSLWTLKGRRTLARVDRDGRILEETALGDAHFGLFAAGERLVYQRADFTPPAPALQVGSPDGARRTAWSAISTRTFPSLARASVAALNMLSCGETAARERACWFPDEAAVWLVTEGGDTRRVPLSGLDLVAPEVLLTSDNPRRPVRDAYVDADEHLWVLSSGVPSPGAEQAPGGWVLAHYAPTGAAEGAARLSEPARVILRADRARVLLLTSRGMVARVDAW
jgi:hypothetical protein